jgi:hypothetical protein
MLLNGPEYDGEYGSPLEVILKQRPQASPAPELAPNAHVLTAAVYPYVVMPHAAKGRFGQHGLCGVLNHETIDAELTGMTTARVRRERRAATGCLAPATIRTVRTGVLGIAGLGGATMLVHHAV